MSLISDSIRILGTSGIIASGTLVTLRPAGSGDLAGEDNGDAINLGSLHDDTTDTLELSDAELDLITAGTLQIGDVNSGTITVSGDGNDVVLISGIAKVEFGTSTASDTESSGGNLPRLLVKGTLATSQTIDVSIIGGSATAGTDYTAIVVAMFTILGDSLGHQRYGDGHGQ